MTTMANEALVNCAGGIGGSGMQIYPQPVQTSLVQITSTRTKAGWLGQLVYKGEIVWESAPKRDGVEAEQEAEKQLTYRLNYQWPVTC
jgi:hypothetical protein